MAGDRPGAAAGHARRRGSGSATRATGSSRAATRIWRSARKPGRPTWPRRKRSARAPRSWRPRREWERGGEPRSAGCRPTGRTSGRCAAPSRRRCGSASGRRATRSSIATSGATRSSSKPGRRIARRSSPSSNRSRPQAAARRRGCTRRTRTATSRRRRPIPSRTRRCSSRSARCAPGGTSRRTAVRQGADPLSGRFMSALERLLAAYPDAFRGTELDVDANRQQMEKLCARVEGFLTDAAAPRRARRRRSRRCCARRSPRTRSAAAPARNPSGAAMAEDVRRRRPSWSRLGPVPGRAGRQLADRFHRACSRFFDQIPPARAASRSPSRAREPSGRGKTELDANSQLPRRSARSSWVKSPRLSPPDIWELGAWLVGRYFLYRTFPPTIV